jgi:hypothetical protein
MNNKPESDLLNAKKKYKIRKLVENATKNDNIHFNDV